MSGHFHKIIGKTISGVYCRGNEVTPRSQVFLVFDDDTHFEMYSSESEIKGANGLDHGGMDAVHSLNHPRGKETCRCPSISMWYPVLHGNTDKRAIMAVPSDDVISTSSVYWNSLVNHLQNLVDLLPVDKARELIEYYLSDGTDITHNYNPQDWGEMIVHSAEMEPLLTDVISEIDNGTSLSIEQQQEFNQNNRNLGFEDILQAVQFKFDLTDEDQHILNKIDELVVESLQRQHFGPGDIVSIGKFLYVLRMLPLGVPGADFNIRFVQKYNSSISLECSISDGRVSFSYGGSESGDASCFFEVGLYIDGSREEEGQLSYIEDDYLHPDGIEMYITDESGEEVARRMTA